MPATRDIAVLVGSLRKAAFTRKLAEALRPLAPASLNLRIVEIGDLPLYNEDLETETPPAAWTRFREQIKAADGLVFVTPEYNRSLPAVLKNAIDVGSRPWGKSVWNGLPAGVISASPGALGGALAHQHLRQSVAVLNVAVMPTPEMYLSQIAKAFDESGALQEGPVKELAEKFLAAFADWAEKHARG